MEALLLFLFFALLAIFLVMRKVVISAFSRSYEIAQFEPWKSKKEIARDEWEAENKRLLAEIKANDAANRSDRSEADQEDLSSKGEVKHGPRGGRYTEDQTKDGRPFRRYF